VISFTFWSSIQGLEYCGPGPSVSSQSLALVLTT